MAKNYPHVRVEIPRVYDRSTGELRPGARVIATDDKIIVVGEDGQEVDISSVVNYWSTEGNLGEIRVLRLNVLAFEIERPRVEQATAAPGELR